MAWYAQIGTDSIIQQVLYVADVYDGNWVTQTYGGTWVCVDEDTGVQKHFPSVGYTYDAGKNVFIPPRPYLSWILDNSTYLWAAPVPYPTDGKGYRWNEAQQIWVEVYAGNS
jgi:hypothetical protein